MLLITRDNMETKFNLTIRGVLEKKLFEIGMFPEQASEVLDDMEINMPEMKGRWTEGFAYYPEPMRPVLLLTAKSYALKWVDVNLPEAFYRQLLI